LRFLAKGELNISDKLVLLNFVKSSFLSYFAFKNLLKKKKFDLVFLNHGIYVPQGIFVDVAKLNKVKVVTWSVSSRKSRFIFSHNDTYHRTLLNEPISNWENIHFRNKEKKLIQLYIKSREVGKNDWIYFHNPKPDFDIKKFFKKKNISQKKFIVTLLTNVIWDAQLHFQKNIFKNMMDWIIKTIKFYKTTDFF
jgi:predicted RNA-binding protein associated with RNAse of E/G family